MNDDLYLLMAIPEAFCLVISTDFVACACLVRCLVNRRCGKGWVRCVRLIYVITVSKVELHLLHIRFSPHAGGCFIVYFVMTTKIIIVG